MFFEKVYNMFFEKVYMFFEKVYIFLKSIYFLRKAPSRTPYLGWTPNLLQAWVRWSRATANKRAPVRAILKCCTGP